MKDPEARRTRCGVTRSRGIQIGFFSPGKTVRSLSFVTPPAEETEWKTAGEGAARPNHGHDSNKLQNGQQVFTYEGSARKS